MANEILSLVYVINELFGNIWIFLAVYFLMVLGFTAKYKLNFQTTLSLWAFSSFCIALIYAGIQSWLIFLVIVIGIFGGMIISRFWKKD
jgi:hypothetical protein